MSLKRPKKAPKRHPKSSKTSKKRDPKRDPKISHFWTNFGPILGPILGPKIAPNRDQKWTPKKAKSVTSKDGIKMGGLGGLSTPRQAPTSHTYAKKLPSQTSKKT